MVTRKLINPSLALSAASLLGLFSHQAAAVEEIVVYATDAATKAVYQPAAFHSKVDVYLRAAFHSEVEAYVRSLNERIQITLDKDLKQAPSKFILAEGETGIRG